MMRIQAIAKLLIAAFAASLWIAPASANTKEFWVNNKTNETVKVCFFARKITMNGILCKPIGKNSSLVVFLDQRDFEPSVDVAVFRPALFDKLICRENRVIITGVVGFHINGKSSNKSCVDAAYPKQRDDRVDVRSWKKDDRVLVKIGRVGYWHPATIESVKGGVSYKVRFAKGDRYDVDASVISGDYIRAGTRISGNWLGKGVWYSGVIASRDGDNVKINYDDGDKETTTLSKIRVAFGDLPKEPAKYTMRVCNNIDERLFFAISFALTSDNVRTEGWWSMNPNSCITVDMSKRWKLAGLPEGQSAATYIYGETVGIFGGAIKKTWEGEDAVAAFCVNKNKRFYFKNQHYRTNTTVLAACKGPAKERVRMSDVRLPSNGTQMRFNFDGR